jgi:hypothetical protein
LWLGTAAPNRLPMEVEASRLQQGLQGLLGLAQTQARLVAQTAEALLQATGCLQVQEFPRDGPGGLGIFAQIAHTLSARTAKAQLETRS